MKNIIDQALKYGFRLRNKKRIHEVIYTPARKYGVQLYYRAELDLTGWMLTRVVRITPAAVERIAKNENFDFFAI